MSSGKEKILICIDWYLPGYKAGGPIRSIANLVDSLQHDYEVFVLTSAYDLGEEEPYQDILLNEWVAKDEYFVKYLDQRHQTKGVITTNIKMLQPDYIYLNSMFSKTFTFFPLRASRKMKTVKTILAPRGMLGDGALAIKSRKKNVFIKASQWTKVFKNVLWHPTSESEKQNIKKFFPKGNLAPILPNLARKSTEDIKDVIEHKQNYDTLKICYISRISEIKNLDFALRVLKDIAADREIEFNIYGKFEEEQYRSTIMTLIDQCQSVKVSLKGAVPPSEVPDIFKRHHLHFLPTKHENYGHSIVESWANGCPVLISDQTPWSNLEMECIGWDCPLDEPEKFKAAIRQLIDMDIVTYNKWVASCFQYYRSFVYKESDYNKYKKHLFSK